MCVKHGWNGASGTTESHNSLHETLYKRSLGVPGYLINIVNGINNVRGEEKTQLELGGGVRAVDTPFTMNALSPPPSGLLSRTFRRWRGPPRNNNNAMNSSFQCKTKTLELNAQLLQFSSSSSSSKVPLTIPLSVCLGFIRTVGIVTLAIAGTILVGRPNGVCRTKEKKCDGPVLCLGYSQA